MQYKIQPNSDDISSFIPYFYTIHANKLIGVLIKLIPIAVNVAKLSMEVLYEKLELFIKRYKNIKHKVV